MKGEFLGFFFSVWYTVMVTVQVGLDIYCADRKKSIIGIELGIFIEVVLNNSVTV